jgi:lantibiotic modifying enzyme
MAAWCHGAPGIGLARLTCLPWMEDGETRADLERALAITLRHAPGQADHLCCGSAGVIDILAQAGRSLDRPALTHRARALAWHIVQRARQSDDYALGLPSAGRLRMPGLFQGLSGIGLMLVRLTASNDMPEPLLLR